MTGKDYKPQIDGLRALAVLPVVLFHAGFESFKGGFVGVDIFFVVSGYLITLIILKDLSKDKFKITNFYIRRARRILPILFFITFVSLVVSLFLMTNEQIKFFSQQAISVVFFFSNFFFWENTGYFSANSELQPLLHTWSLGVEEQFYIFFPIFLLFIWRFYKKRVFLFLTFVLLISLFISQLGGNFKLQNLSLNFPFLNLPFEFFWQAGSANFYLPFGRIWELLFGSLVGIYTFKIKIKDQPLNNIYSLIGFILIVISIVYFSKDLQYPSIFTLLPVVGTVLIIIFSTNSTILFRILSFKPLVFLGLISYSLYLWHQPLLAFARIYYDKNLSYITSLSLIIISLILSVISWRFIEKPFRDRNILNDKKIIIYLSSLALVITLFSVLIYYEKMNFKKQVLPKRITQSFEATTKGDCFDIKLAHLDDKKKWYCDIGNIHKNFSFAVIGDSHALSLKPAFDQIATNNNTRGFLAGFAGCPGLIGINSIRGNFNEKNCKILNKKIFNFVKKNDIKKIFLVSRWSYYTNGNYDGTNLNLVSKEDSMFSNKRVSRNSIIYGLKNTINKYEEIGVEIIFVHQVPLQIYSPNYVFLKSTKNNKQTDFKKIKNLSVDYVEHKQLQKFVRDNIKIIKKDHDFKEIDFDKFFCDNKKCLYGRNDTSYYSDKDHLSIKGALSLTREIEINF